MVVELFEILCTNVEIGVVFEIHHHVCIEDLPVNFPEAMQTRMSSNFNKGDLRYVENVTRAISGGNFVLQVHV